MSETVPYLATPGSIKTALERIRTAATPERVTRDFVSTKLQIKGGTGAAIIPFLKKIGFVATDGSPTELYKRFRNQSTGGSAVAQATKKAYSALGAVNEYFYDLSDQELTDLILQVTGLERDDPVARLTFTTLKNLKSFAKFDGESETEVPSPSVLVAKSEGTQQRQHEDGKRVGLNLAYTINLNLPATSDQAVFNAIFRSLKEHILDHD